MTTLRQRMIGEMRRRKGEQPNTEKTYIRAVAAFAAYFDKSPERLGKEHVRHYLLHLIEGEHQAESSVNVAYWALRFLYDQVLEKKGLLDDVSHPKDTKKLPVILNQDELKQFFGAIINIKHRAMLTVPLDAGLRSSEVAKLRIEHIDSGRMLIRVHQGKGKKDRYVNLSPPLLELLRDYWKARRPQQWLFPGRYPERHICRTQISNVCRQIRERAKMRKAVTPHMLRHTFATMLLDVGIDIRRIQILLGHRSLKTTERYTHVSYQALRATPTPLQLIQRQEQQAKGLQGIATPLQLIQPQTLQRKGKQSS